jgi:hypothetical protein
MKVAGMMRLAEIDQEKVGKELMKVSILRLSDKVSHLYFLKIGNIDNDLLEFIEKLNKPYKITDSENDYMTGWMFKNNESLDDLYKTIDTQYDWVLYPDADDLLPDNVLDILKEADDKNADTVRFYFLECFGSENDIIEIKSGYPIGPHFKAVKHRSDITFVGSDGFNEACCNLVRHETEYCVRHLRYATKEGVEKRKSMNYFQDYFLQDHDTIPYSPNEKINYYLR